MAELTGYRIDERLFITGKTAIHRGLSLRNNKEVFIKTVLPSYDSLRTNASLLHESIIAGKAGSGIISIIETIESGDKIALAIEPFTGIQLSTLIAEKSLATIDTLRIASSLVDILGELHKNGIIHRNLKPSIITVDTATGGVLLIDMSYALNISQTDSDITAINLPGTETDYISPEQTGYMNRPIDYRTDFYLLGLIFYEMLTGLPPFHSDDLTELIYSHISKKAVPPSELNPEIPPAVSGIVMKLLEKNAENRYLSSWGIRSDISRCIDYIIHEKPLTNFTAGENDVSEILSIPLKLYGREKETAALLDSFMTVAGGESAIVLVKGAAGSGKTALVHEIKKMLPWSGGFFIEGSFEKNRADIPFSAIISALNEFIRRLMIEPADSLEKWKEKILEELGQNGRILADIIPDIEMITGKMPDVAELGSGESKNRFIIVFQNFLRSIASAEHPLVMFIDDIQYADAESLKLLDLIISDAGSRYLMIICGLRDTDSGTVNPVLEAVESIGRAARQYLSIELTPLDIYNINIMLSEMLRIDKEKTEILAEIISEKTLGNPLFISQFIKKINTEGHFNLNSSTGQWEWDTGPIRRMETDDNIAELFVEKIKRLDEQTKRFLSTAACIGNSFELSMLTAVSGISIKSAALILSAAVHNGFVIPLDETFDRIGSSRTADTAQYRFLHSRIHDAFYSLIDINEREIIHIKAGRYLVENIPEKSRNEKLFETVLQFNSGRRALTREEDLILLAKLDLEASQRAKSSGAYTQALLFLGAAIEVLPLSMWETNYTLIFSIYREWSECEYLSGNFAKAEELFDLLMSRAKSNLDKGEVSVIRIILYANMGKFVENNRIGAASCAIFGIGIPDPDNRDEIREMISEEFDTYKKYMKGREIKDLAHLPETHEPEMATCLKLIMNMLSSAYVSNPLFLDALVLKGVNLSIKHGVAPGTTFIFCSWCLITSVKLDDYKSGNEFGMVAFAFNERFNHPATRSNVPFVFGNFIHHWRGHIAENIIYLHESFRAGVDNGDFIYGSFAATSIPRYLLAYGHDPLSKVLEETEETLAFFKRIKNYASLERQELTRQAVLSLMGRKEDTSSLSTADFDELSHIMRMTNIHYGTGVALYYYYKLLTLYMSGLYDQAFSMAQEGMKHISFIVNSIQQAELVFYHSLCMTRLYETVNENERKNYLASLSDNLARLELWFNNCSENFSTRYHLVKAEYCSITGDAWNATRFYDRAIHDAEENGFIALSALCSELASEFHRKTGNNHSADMLIAESLEYYRAWGAEARIRLIEQKYENNIYKLQLLKSSILHAKDYNAGNKSIPEENRKASDIIDLISVIRASQTISEDIQLENLITRLMKVLIENAGAQNGILLIEKEGWPAIEALAVTRDDSINISISKISSAGTHYPESMVNYVKRTGESLILGDASSSGIFISDPYIIHNAPKSVLCIPVKQSAEITSILYLENRISSDAFDRSRLDVLNILCSQAAISLENALNYEETVRIKESLRESEENYRVLFENIQDVFYRADVNGNILLTSPSFSRMFGYTCEEVIGMNIATIMYINPDDRSVLLDTLNRKGFIEDYEVQLKRKDGSSIWVATNSHYYYKNGAPAGVEGLLRDITARKTAEAQMMAEKERLAVTLRSIGEGVIVTDLEKRVILINRVAEKITGQSQEKASGRIIDDVFMIKDRDDTYCCGRIMEKLITTGELVEIEDGLKLTCQDETNLLIALSAAPIRDEKSHIIGTAIVFRDITEKHRLEEELLKTQKLESISIFAGGIAHDFNNILTGILGNVSLSMLYIDNREKLITKLADIEKASVRAKDLTQQLLTFSRGGVPIKKTTSIVELIRESVKLVMSGSNVKCEIEVHEPVSPVEADEGQINQVFNNIIINAIQSMPGGGVINISVENLPAGSQSDGGETTAYIGITISDHGIGIPAANLMKIFDPFFTTKPGGNGLGLATSYSIIKKHGGNITVESEMGKGTSFHILLPASDRIIKAVPGHIEENFKGRGRILIMDDEDIVINVCSEMLIDLGYETVAVKDGDQVVEKYSESVRSGNPFSFVIMDLTIPGGAGGKYAIKKLIEIDPGVKAIVSSGYSNDPIMSDYRSYGFSGIIVKPYKFDELKDLLYSMSREE